jgi:hypothetical protein
MYVLSCILSINNLKAKSSYKYFRFLNMIGIPLVVIHLLNLANLVSSYEKCEILLNNNKINSFIENKQLLIMEKYEFQFGLESKNISKKNNPIGNYL